MNKLLSVPDKPAVRGLITASGGNHGLGVAYAAYVTGVPANIYLPTTTPAAKIEKLRRWGADTIVDGETWDQSNRIALSVAQRDGLTYIHAFADPMVIAGQGTVGLEILQEAPEIDTIVVVSVAEASFRASRLPRRRSNRASALWESSPRVQLPCIAASVPAVSFNSIESRPLLPPLAPWRLNN
jgi:threonine dehydratase